jgi:hypothetical protein
MLRSKNPTVRRASDLRAFAPALSLAVFAVWAPLAAHAGSATATATVTVETEGGVGEVSPSPTPESTPTPAPVASTANDISTTNGGGAKTPEAAVTQAGVTTFRPLPTLAAPAAETGDGGETGDATETSGAGSSDGGQGAAAAAPRLPRGARPVGNLLGGVSAVSVSGSPNQAYGISLPGNTVINTGTQTTVIEGFVHNAGETPTVSPSGQGSFSVGAQVAGDGEGGGGGNTGEGGGTGTAATNNDGPVTISDPFMDVIIQYN